MRNAVFAQRARERGDLGQAVVLEDLGHVLTNIDAAPRNRGSGLRLRLEWNTSGLLFDVRILQQNEASARARMYEELP